MLTPECNATLASAKSFMKKNVIVGLLFRFSRIIFVFVSLFFKKKKKKIIFMNDLVLDDVALH
jgi:hypothetical protein